MMNSKHLISALLLFGCITASAGAKTVVCNDTYGWKFGNLFANCVSEYTAALAVKMPKQVRKCNPPTYAFLRHEYASCLQNNFDRARKTLKLQPRICDPGKEELFHPHTNQKWTNCIRRQIIEIDAAF